MCFQGVPSCFAGSCFAAAVHGRGGDGSTPVIHTVRISWTHTWRLPRGSLSGWNADPLWLSSGSGVHKVRVGAQGMSGCTRYEWVHKVRVGVHGMSQGTRYEWVCKVHVGAHGMSGCTWYEWVHMYEWVHKVRVGAHVRVGVQGMSGGRRDEWVHMYKWVHKVQVGVQGMSVGS